MNQQPHLLISHGQIATGILVCGEPDRVNRIAERFLTNSVLIAENREYRIINGDYQGNPVTLWYGDGRTINDYCFRRTQTLWR